MTTRPTTLGELRGSGIDSQILTHYPQTNGVARKLIILRTIR